jgi:hypothetical protein
VKKTVKNSKKIDKLDYWGLKLQGFSFDAGELV